MTMSLLYTYENVRASSPFIFAISTAFYILYLSIILPCNVLRSNIDQIGAVFSPRDTLILNILLNSSQHDLFYFLFIFLSMFT